VRNIFFRLDFSFPNRENCSTTCIRTFVQSFEIMVNLERLQFSPKGKSFAIDDISKNYNSFKNYTIQK